MVKWGRLSEKPSSPHRRRANCGRSKSGVFEYLFQVCIFKKEQGHCRFFCFHFSKSRCQKRSCFLPSGPYLSSIRATKENSLVMPLTSGCLVNTGTECGPPSKRNKSWNVPLSHQPLFCLVYVLSSSVSLVLSRENGSDLRKNMDRVKILLPAATSKECFVVFFPLLPQQLLLMFCSWNTSLWNFRKSHILLF